MSRPDRLKVGVTLFLRKGRQSLWENGIFQNSFFLIELLKRSPLVETAYLVNGGDGSVEESSEFLALAPAPVIDMQSALETLDVVIELSAQLNAGWTIEFRARGGRVVGMRVANDYVIDVERMTFNLPQGMLVSGTPYDVVWTLPAFEHTCASYYEVALRAPVRTMQHLWSPALLERSLRSSGASESFGYVPGRSQWRLAVLEPNVCMVKASQLPMLIADLAYRQEPESFEYLRVFNSLQLKADANFVKFCRSLDLVQHGIATFEARFAIYEIMSRQADAIVAHHWENGQNYLYYEALYGGYPLIHNSRFINGCGYYYPEFDCAEGALALRQAFSEHDSRLSDYRAAANSFLATLDPLSDANVRQYTTELASLFTRS
ncbi:MULTISPECIES: DUF2827 domain-containing protein [Paraburkholderia]|uniref:DUF2827 domain-containing protein n=1 Tax=Paraburkholderia TaxID=1822464 RepID=UPI0022504665|nr:MULTISPECIES: DUF2827 domain-containing protein [Paraburkholderia]MCX4159619.1 DUF2827 domain-containing protein [Paraburkholderia aspalathi]MDN7169017.1 DUF2827 domain-containing protein [Paraburkholderia sp. SECH2]MDQ6397504.1 DUF2827 domain-containing protein [Paraburkholderia aspalathi]